MNLKNGAKRAAKFTFVEMPLSILGWRQLRANNGYIRDLWRTLRHPQCPECGRGVMHLPADAQPDEKALYPWECSAKCGFGVLAPQDPTEIRHIVQARSETRGKQRLAFLGDPERDKLITSHLRKSRAYWVVVALVFLMAAWQLAIGAPMMVVLSVLCMCLPFSVHAIRWSYRAWQVRSGTLFVEGAFGRYVRDMLWVRGIQ
ncbi:hypothetical protein VNPA152081_48540 [Pseudomonas aeruginosa]|uniref:hypothetical protein n=1 Tax=Pseudomonas aeruginosa TaxID=287 RepID=UPI0021E1BE76|nr:hypothetical protein [Pseudomonas aeruginosa]GLF60617.1 hypothetical protein VNPA141826_47800 [Pseudomonas aeruginosa]GLF79778.1 hypothetical protein VNPA152081_48540 [Pseudomonas aeruginosa]